MAQPLLAISDLHVSFFTEHGEVRAVRGIDLEIQPGQTLALVGESGCGKSATALSIMRLIESPGRIVNGSLMYNGRDLAQLSEAELRSIRGKSIGMIFQEPMTSLNPVFTIGHQIGEVFRLHQGLSVREANQEAGRLLETVGIPSPRQRLEHYPHELSGGMKQRVMIAMALACRPDLLIADEPTTALDVTVQAQILDLLTRLQDELGMAILLITHNLGVVAQFAQDVAVMYAGKNYRTRPGASAVSQPVAPLHPGAAPRRAASRSPLRTAGRDHRQCAFALTVSAGLCLCRPLSGNARCLPDQTALAERGRARSRGRMLAA